MKKRDMFRIYFVLVRKNAWSLWKRMTETTFQRSAQYGNKLDSMSFRTQNFIFIFLFKS